MRRTMAAALVLAMLTACVPGTNPAARPQPGDNVLEVQIHAYGWTSRKDDVVELRRDIKARVDVTNGDDEPFIGDDGKPITNWRHDTSTGHPWRLVLSQPADSPAKGIRVSLRARVAEMPGDEQINLVCNFIVNGVEDVKNAQAGVGPEIVCMYRTGF